MALTKEDLRAIDSLLVKRVDEVVTKRLDERFDKQTLELCSFIQDHVLTQLDDIYHKLVQHDNQFDKVYARLSSLEPAESPQR
jgi:hypothetical protein